MWHNLWSMTMNFVINIYIIKTIINHFPPPPTTPTPTP